MKWYHKLSYRIFYWLWTPLFKARPDLLRAILNYGEGWLDQRDEEINSRRQSFRLVSSRNSGDSDV